jgi:hypothetical protein
MALTPVNEIHALQIQAGTFGRRAGHRFEDAITRAVNEFQYPFRVENPMDGHVFIGNPALSLLNYIGKSEGIGVITSAVAISTGALATSEEGKNWLSINGAALSRCKSDLVVTINSENGRNLTIGISTKQCSKKIPTNAQLYFTTARGFSNLLQSNGIAVSENAFLALRQFCGDQGFCPSDDLIVNRNRIIDPRRYFWEEINAVGREEWEHIFCRYQDEISRLLFQKAYLNDPFIPDYLLHKTKLSPSWEQTEVAIFTIDELITLSRNYQGFVTRSYSVNKGSYRDPVGIQHLAPRFGVIQMQRGGQAQHPAQLQFNLKAGYFYDI